MGVSVCARERARKTAGRDTRLIRQRELPTHALLPAFAVQRLNMRTDATARGLVSENHRRISRKGYQSLAGRPNAADKDHYPRRVGIVKHPRRVLGADGANFRQAYLPIGKGPRQSAAGRVANTSRAFPAAVALVHKELAFAASSLFSRPGRRFGFAADGPLFNEAV